MISLKDFLNFDYTQDIKTLYPVKNSDQIYVQYISILEHPVEQFVREGEVVISTALSIRDNTEDLYNFINEIYLSKAAAIMLSFPNDTYNQLDEIKDYFKSINFPILTLPWNHLFSDVVERTIKKIWDEEKESESYLDFLQKDLLKNYLSGQSLEYAIKIIYKYLNTDIAILDTNNTVRGFCTSNKSVDFLSQNNFQKLNKIPIISGDKLYGYLVYEENATYTISNPEIMEQRIIMPLTLWFDKEWSITTSLMRSKSDFVWQLANQDLKNSSEIISNAENLGFNTSCNYMCFVGNIATKHVNENPEYSLTASVINIINDQILLSAKTLELSVMTTVYKKTIIIYLEKGNNVNGLNFANNFLDLLEDCLKKYLPNTKILWGYDNQPLSIDNLSTSYKNASTALKVCLDIPGYSSRNCFQFSIWQRILITLSNDEETVYLAKNALQNIINYDEEKNSDLLDTLECYCKTNYNISETARLMHLHRQSLLYRMNLIESLCSLSLKNHNDLFVLEICILILRMGG